MVTASQKKTGSKTIAWATGAENANAIVRNTQNTHPCGNVAMMLWAAQFFAPVSIIAPVLGTEKLLDQVLSSHIR